MIKSIKIENFKAIKELTVRFTSLTMLIGENSCGKSTILQALDFLCSIVTRDIEEYLKDREWSFEEIKSQFSNINDFIKFTTEFDINGELLTWEFFVNKNGKWIIKERIINSKSKEVFLSFGSGKDTPYDFSGFNIESSALKLLDLNDKNRRRKVFEDTPTEKFNPVLYKLKEFLINSNSFDLLSPHRMLSKESRGKVTNIGKGGEKLSAYIHSMNSTRKSELNKIVSKFIGYDVKITTTTKGQPGWVEMFLEESWGNDTIKVKKRYISEGLLRIIAFSVIMIALKPTSNFQDTFLVMFDEIEDGINPSLSGELIENFRKSASESGKQVIVTSHSPVMVNYLEQDEIIYMWRDKNGLIHARPMFGADKMKETLDCFNPGEVWLNYSKEEILTLINPSERSKKDD
jgi:predicted ATPase